MLIDAATDDYQRLIVRTRPWTKQREEELLEAFTEWLYEQPGQRRTLEAIDPEVVQHYAAVTNMSEAEQNELLAVMRNVYRWANKQGWITANTFSVTTLV